MSSMRAAQTVKLKLSRDEGVASDDDNLMSPNAKLSSLVVTVQC
jgi:hypothetical protein